MWWPGRIPAGSVCSEIAGTIDILPTVAELTGATLPTRKIDGHSIVSLLEGKSGAKSPHQAYFYQARGVRVGEWKMLVSGGCKPKENGKLLFNLVKDIGEKNNVAAEHPDVVKRLSDLLEAFKKEVQANGRPAG